MPALRPAPRRASSSPPPIAAHSAAGRRPGRELWSAVWFLLPGFLGLVAFLILPLFASLVLSFSNWQVIGQTRFVGCANYVNLFDADPIFWSVFRVTLLYTAEYLVLNIVISLGMARVDRQPVVGQAVVPAGVLSADLHAAGRHRSGLAADVDAGRHRRLDDGRLGMPIPNLITAPRYALQVVVIVSLWSHFGYNLLLFGAALESIPQPTSTRPRSTAPDPGSGSGASSCR